MDIRELLLSVIKEQSPKSVGEGSNLQTGPVLSEVRQRLGPVRNVEIEEEVLTQFHDLFRTGYLAWGH